MKAIANLGPSGFRTEIKVGHHLEHVVVSDEPTEKGGQNGGPTAFGLLASALAACTVATLKSYANLKNIALDGLTVDVNIERRTPSEQNEAGPNAKATVISKKITIHSKTITEDQRKRMLEIAEKCPVNRALLEGADISKL